MPRALINLLFPPHCLVCNNAVTEHGTLCQTCWQGVRFITDPYCACCGQPFDFALGKDALCGQWLASFGRELIETSDAMVPVPLHYWRFVGRRYNQSALLAYSIKKRCGLSVLPDALKRTRATKPQPGLTRKQRKTNVKNAFAVSAHALPLIKNKTVLLIDDVMTTSATIGECAKTLLSAGASHVNVLTLARKAG